MNEFSARDSAADRSSCSRCVHRPLCQDTAPADQYPGRRIRIERRASLYQAGEQAGERIYNIRSGSFKLLRAAPRGEALVVGFALPPAFLGLNALGAAQHEDSAVALEDSEVCAISWHRAAAHGRREPLMRPGLHALLAREIRREQRAALMLRNTHAAQRMAELMLSLSRCHAANGYAATRFRLPMSRCDIASYLGVTAECVSRLIALFERQSLFELSRRDATLLDLPALQRVAAGHTPAEVQA